MNLLLAALWSAALASPGPAAEEPLVDVPCFFAPVFFDLGSAELRGHSASYLESGYYREFQVYRPESRARFILTSYTSDAGSQRANRRLARRREAAVRRYLVSRGIADDRISSAAVRPDLWEAAQGRAVFIDVQVTRSLLFQVMPPGGPIC